MKAKEIREAKMIKWIFDRNLEITQAEELAKEFKVTMAYSRSLLLRIHKYKIQNG